MAKAKNTKKKKPAGRDKELAQVALRLTPRDREQIELIKEANALISDSQAVRFALHRVAEQGGKLTAALAEEMAPGRAKEGEEPRKLVIFRLTANELASLDKIVEERKRDSKSDAIRFAIWVEANRS